MRLFLASYKYGGHEQELQDFFSGCTKIALILNAQDSTQYAGLRDQKLADDISDWRKFGFDCEEIDLRNYFADSDALRTKLDEFDGIWVRGGNCFVLRQAMKQSHFDEIIKKRILEGATVYGGYSAGVCVLGKTLRGLEICDDVDSAKELYRDIEWQGLGITDYTIVPHYNSAHPESSATEDVIRYLVTHNIPYRTLQDNQVLVIDGNEEKVLT